MKLTEDQKEDIVGAYKYGETTADLSRKYSVSSTAIHKVLIRMGVEVRSRSETSRKGREVNEKAFDNPQKKDTAYWLGHIMADGNVTSKREGKSPVVSLELQGDDAKHVRNFAKFLGASHKVGEKNRTDGRKSAYVGLRSQVLADKLASYGVVSQKTGNQKAKKGLDKNPAFWRGYIDGNGSIGRDKNGSPTLGVVGSEAIVKQFARFAKCLTGKDFTVGKSGNLYQITLGGEAAKKVIRATYGKPGEALSRKLKVVRQILERRHVRK